jgi:hypothetical protein
MARRPSPKVTTLGKQAKSAVPESLFSEDFHESLVHDAARAGAVRPSVLSLVATRSR